MAVGCVIELAARVASRELKVRSGPRRGWEGAPGGPGRSAGGSGPAGSGCGQGGGTGAGRAAARCGSAGAEAAGGSASAKLS